MEAKRFTLKLEDAPLGTAALLKLAKDLEPTGVPMQPFALLLQRETTLVFLLDLAKSQLELLSSKAALLSPTLLIDALLQWLCSCKWVPAYTVACRSKVVRAPAGRDIFPPPSHKTTANILITVDPEVLGIFDSVEWATFDLIMTVFRRALCELPTPALIQGVDGLEVLLFEAVAAASSSLVQFVTEWWEGEKRHGRPDLPPFLARSLLLAVQTISTIPHILVDSPVYQIPFMTASLYIPELLELLPPFSALMPGEPAGQPPAARYSAARGASGSGRGRGSKAGLPRGGQSLAGSPAPQASQELQAAQTEHDLHLRSTLDLRGLVHACWCALHRAALLAVKYKLPIPGNCLRVVLSRIHEMLHALHLSNPTPVTDPCPALRVVSASRGLASARRGRGAGGSSGHQKDAGSVGPLYRSGHIWVPDTYSLGPAPALVAGAQFTQLLIGISNKNPYGTPEVITLLKYSSTLTRLAQAMATEAAGEHFSTRIRQDEGAFKGWCDVSTALCDTAFYLLHALGQLSGIDTAVARYRVHRAKQPAHQHQEEEDMQRHQQGQVPQAEQPAGQEELVYLCLDPAVAALLPVLAASSLCLVHASLACVRVFDTQFKAGDIPFLNTTRVLSLIQTTRSAVLMYEYLVRLASMPAPHGAETSAATSSTPGASGLATPGCAPAQPASSTVPSSITVAAAAPQTAATAAPSAVPEPAAGGEGAAGGKGDVVSSEELLPPDFQRYCAAVATWGPNLGCISMMVTISLQAMHRPDMLGSASHLLSWDTGLPGGAALYTPLVTCVESAASLLAKTGGDLAGWMGDLAPRGGLDSAQLLHRLFMSSTTHLQSASARNQLDSTNCATVDALVWHGLLMLAAAFHMLCPPAGAEGSKCPAVGSPGTPTTSSPSASGGTETKGAGGTGSAGLGSGKRQRQGKGQDTPASSDSEAMVFIRAWLQSPASMDYFENTCNISKPTRDCRAKVMEVIVNHVLQSVDSQMLCKLNIDLPGSMTLETVIKDPTIITKQHQPYPHLGGRALSMLIDKEPLRQLLLKEYQVAKETLKSAATYRPREAAEHSQRLQAYVEAAAARAGGQLDPGLRKELYEALGLQL